MPYTETQAQSGLGTTFAINTGTASVPVWTTIGEIVTAPQSGRMVKTADATNLESLAVEWIATLVDSGTFDITTNRVAGDAGQVAVEAAFVARTRQPYKVTLPMTASQSTAGDTFSFSALVEESNPLADISTDKVIQDKFKLKVSGAITFAAGS